MKHWCNIGTTQIFLAKILDKQIKIASCRKGAVEEVVIALKIVQQTSRSSTVEDSGLSYIRANNIEDAGEGMDPTSLEENFCRRGNHIDRMKCFFKKKEKKSGVVACSRRLVVAEI